MATEHAKFKNNEILERDEIIKLYNDTLLENYFDEILRYLQTIVPEEMLKEKRKKVIERFRDKPEEFYDLLKGVWNLHNSLSLMESRLINSVKDLLIYPAGVGFLIELFSIHDVLDKTIYIMSPLIKDILEYNIDKLSKNYNLTQEDIFTLGTPIKSSFYIIRWKRLSELYLTYGPVLQTSSDDVKRISEELYGGSIELLRRDYERFIKSLQNRKDIIFQDIDDDLNKLILRINKNRLADKIGDIVITIDKLLELDNYDEYIYFRSALYGLEDYHLRKIVLNETAGKDLSDLNFILRNKKQDMEKVLKYQIPRYKQNYVCFSACLANIIWHFRKDVGSLKELEFEITKEATAYPYLFILIPKLALIAKKKFGLNAIVYQSKKEIPEYEVAKREYDNWGMKFYRLITLTPKYIDYREEDITKESYEFIKQKYQESLNEAIKNGIKLIIAEPTPDLLENELKNHRLSTWVRMIGKYGHSVLNYGYFNEGKNKIFYFFDPIYGGVIVKEDEVLEFLKSPVMYLGLSIYMDNEDVEIVSSKLREAREFITSKLNEII
jgi:hypothetical protein